MKKLKSPIKSKVKQTLKEQRLYKDYKKTFQHRQMRFLITKITYLFEIEIDPIKMAEFEKTLINQNNKEMFCWALKEIFALSKNLKLQKINTNNLAYFLYYIYQTSRYYSDIRKKCTNVFIDSNSKMKLIKHNALKREYYHSFYLEIEKIFVNYNYYIINLLKLVL